MSTDELIEFATQLLASRKGASGERVREKATIVKVGTIDPRTQLPVGWTFNGEGRAVAGVEINNGKVTYCGGYSLAELAIISNNQSETLA